MSAQISVTVTDGVTIISPARRVSDHVGLTLKGGALTITIPAVAAIAREGGAVLGAVASAENNHSSVQPGLDRAERWGGNYVPGGWAGDSVATLVSDGRGRRRGSEAQTVRLRLTAVAADALAFVASQTDCVSVWVDGTTLTITGEAVG